MSGEEGFSIYGPPVRGRKCGSCTLCCTLVPVDLAPGMHKPANTRCIAQSSSGCRVYQTRPTPCRMWSCRWLFDDDTAELKRPDHAGFVIDCMFDEVLAGGVACHVIQVWVDPKRPDAHQDPALRRYVAHIAERFHMPTLVRWGSSEAMVLVAPSLSDTGEWVEVRNATLPAEEMKRRLAEARAQA